MTHINHSSFPSTQSFSLSSPSVTPTPSTTPSTANTTINIPNNITSATLRTSVTVSSHIPPAPSTAYSHNPTAKANTYLQLNMEHDQYEQDMNGEYEPHTPVGKLHHQGRCHPSPAESSDWATNAIWRIESEQTNAPRIPRYVYEHTLCERMDETTALAMYTNLIEKIPQSQLSLKFQIPSPHSHPMVPTSSPTPLSMTDERAVSPIARRQLSPENRRIRRDKEWEALFASPLANMEIPTDFASLPSQPLQHQHQQHRSSDALTLHPLPFSRSVSHTQYQHPIQPSQFPEQTQSRAQSQPQTPHGQIHQYYSQARFQ